jgi:hypothetical protein
MAMTIFIGFNPHLGPLPAGAGCGHSPLSLVACRQIARGKATATNQAPCQFVAMGVSAWK